MYIFLLILSKKSRPLLSSNTTLLSLSIAVRVRVSIGLGSLVRDAKHVIMIA